MKWLLIIIFFIISVTAGYLIAIKYKKRSNFFNSLIMLAQKLDVEINFSRERLKKVIENFDSKNKSNLLGVDNTFINYLNNGGELTSEMLFGKSTLLKNDEKEMILMFFKSLGRMDVESQSKEIKNFISRFESSLTLCLQEEKKYGKLGVKLGVAVGLVVAVILI